MSNGRGPEKRCGAAHTSDDEIGLGGKLCEHIEVSVGPHDGLNAHFPELGGLFCCPHDHGYSEGLREWMGEQRGEDTAADVACLR